MIYALSRFLTLTTMLKGDIIVVLMGSLRMKDKRLYGISLGLVLVLGAALWAYPLAEDFEVYGSLEVDGAAVVVGAELVAVIGADEVARTTVSQAGKYSLVIHAYDPNEPEVKGYTSQDDVITVYVDGRKAEPSFNPREGKVKIDLVVKTTLEVKQTTWGKIKALFK